MGTRSTKRARAAPAAPGGADLSPADRMSAWRRLMRQGGGREVRAYLGGPAWAALEQLAPAGKRGPFIEALVLKAWRERNGG